ncbi:hypothetical protein CPC735_034930 [Coccidioides posadasii C735 delta SOWgp]|uniref:Uncharacterized protein n=1 Tax=Coccidioides posadasii (strain C735) TaxID=222929 RepID=C5P617_COCP7|nr:hypothetical protein CPC735_034930 [Coccidioides posadasii C735 delta SOWgp]EER28157.1 hypothetical protein CPC735_034930 [Coccidioides posadasii C735 delta SOWgp]|eukprot:XP_003070302.1 hypothetical protein CPC735_034930 [Coccidioides posadasii C735 delta SOWgp]
MLSLLDLPDFLLEEVIAMAIGYVNYYDASGTHSVTNKVLSLALLLNCRRINALTDRILLLQGLFHVNTIQGFQSLVDLLGHERLNLVRWIFMPLSNVNLGDNSREGDIATAEDGFEQCISLMNCLSPRLRVLLLRDPSWDKNPMECDRAHRIIAQAVQRFGDLKRLGFLFHHQSLPLCVLLSSSSSYVGSRAASCASVPKRPMFSQLRHLHLHGRLLPHVTSRQLIEALSEQNLPSLIKLDLGHIYHHPQSNDGFEWIVTPEVFLNMHPLVHLRWVTDCDASGAEGSVPHPPPTNDHLVALRQKHGHTLRQLIMQYATWLDETSEPATLGFTRDDAAIFLKNLDLVKVVLTVPHLDLYLVWTTPKAKLEALRSIGISP